MPLSFGPTALGSGDFQMLFSYRQVPVSDAFIDDLAMRLAKWAHSDKDAVILEDFLSDNRISWTAFCDWEKRSTLLEEAHQFALMCIGCRREKGGLYKKMSESMVMKSMPMYSQRWKQLNEWYSHLTEERESRGNITVHMNAIPKVEDTRVKGTK
jgi:hypothetical protein